MKQQKATRIPKTILWDPCWAVGQHGEIQTENKNKLAHVKFRLVDELQTSCFAVCDNCKSTEAYSFINISKVFRIQIQKWQPLVPSKQAFRMKVFMQQEKIVIWDTLLQMFISSAQLIYDWHHQYLSLSDHVTL